MAYAAHFKGYRIFMPKKKKGKIAYFIAYAFIDERVPSIYLRVILNTSPKCTSHVQVFCKNVGHIKKKRVFYTFSWWDIFFIKGLHEVYAFEACMYHFSYIYRPELKI